MDRRLKPVATAPVILYDPSYNSPLVQSARYKHVEFVHTVLGFCNVDRHRRQRYYWYVASKLTSLMKMGDTVGARVRVPAFIHVIIVNEELLGGTKRRLSPPVNAIIFPGNVWQIHQCFIQL